MPISIISPTQGRDTLERMLASGGPLQPGDEWLVVVDTFEQAESELFAISERCKPYGADVFGHNAGRHTWGHDQLNYGMKLAKPGNYIVFNDDDDVFAEGALDRVRAAIAEDEALGFARLHFWQFRTPWRSVLPIWPDIAECRVGGHCIVTPNLPDMVGEFTPEYNGDYRLIAQTVALWGGVDSDRVTFHPELIAITRPEWR